MISLNDWVFRHAKLPLIWLVGLALGVQCLYFGYLTYNRYINQLERIEQMRESISLGVQQSNRPLIESVITSALVNSDVVLATLCAGSAASISYPPSDNSYCHSNARSLWRWPVKKPLVGVQGFELVVVLSPLVAFGPLLFLILITIVMLASIILTMSRVSFRLKDELLNPLCEGLNGEAALKVTELEDLRLRNLEHTRLVRAQAVSEVMVQLSTQVAHDIRSPLAALDAALKNTGQLPEPQRIIVRHAVNRIRDIANNLLEQNRQQIKTTSTAGSSTSGSPVTGEPLEVRLLSSLIDPIITEKRLQFESKSGINIDFELTRESYGLFAKLQPIEFRRLVSNLVNNAVEVLGDKGSVKIGLAVESESIILAVSDNGKGIPPEILKKLGQRGETHGKAGGSGLGLFHARSMAESWGGSLNITSELGKGATVAIIIPKAEALDGFVPVLELIPGRPVVVLDDDATIHQVWRGRFDSARVKEHDIEIVQFSEPDTLREWFVNNSVKAENALYLFDYEFLGCKETGLSLAQEFDLAAKVILVTSRHEEKRVVDECKRLKIRMIPKGLAGLVPISIKPALKISKVAILLDDDVLVHMTWKVAAKAAGIALKAYKTPEDFAAGIETLPKDTPMYIDSELGNNIKGEDIAKDLHEKGFADITMSTGYGPDKFTHLPWLKVSGKEPPFG